MRARAAIPPVPLRKEIETITSYTKMDSSTIVAVQVKVFCKLILVGAYISVSYTIRIRYTFHSLKAIF